jgi:hypothetical protein
MNNIILGCCLLFSFLVIISLLLYHNSDGIFTPYRVFAQNSTMGIDLVQVLMADSIQALNSNDISGALGHLRLIDQQLGIRGNSVPITTSKMLVDDAIQALQNGDTNTARSHVILANQEIRSPSTSSSLVAPGTSRGNLFAGANTMNFVQKGNGFDHGNHKHPGPTPFSCDQKNCLSDPGLGAGTNTGSSAGGGYGSLHIFSGKSPNSHNSHNSPNSPNSPNSHNSHNSGSSGSSGSSSGNS